MSGENIFINQGIDLIKKAQDADEKEDSERALTLYQDGLGNFAKAVKYEKNVSRRKLLMERMGGWMQRAEELKEISTRSIDQKDGGKGGADEKSVNREKDKENESNASKKEVSEEDKKLRGALDSVVVSEKPDVKWEDVAGLESAKESLKEAVIMPVKFPQLFTGERRPFKGILLFGPPGTGKSFLAKAVAAESDSTFFSVSSADLISKWQGESERLVRNLFEMARESSDESGRAIIFVDEVDSLCGTRSEGENDSSRRVKTEFLVQMDGVQASNKPGVLILGATNVPWDLDAAIRRRFERRIHLPLPGPDARTHMLKMNVADTPNDLTEEDYDRLGEATEGASGSDLEVMAKEALMEPLRRCQQAKQFIIEDDGNYVPCTKFPNCALCPRPTLNKDTEGTESKCNNCGAIHMTLWDVPPEKIQAPLVTIQDFEKVMDHAFSTVSEEELKRFQEWTAMFGQEGD